MALHCRPSGSATNVEIQMLAAAAAFLYYFAVIIHLYAWFWPKKCTIQISYLSKIFLSARA